MHDPRFGEVGLACDRINGQCAALSGGLLGQIQGYKLLKPCKKLTIHKVGSLPTFMLAACLVGLALDSSGALPDPLTRGTRGASGSAVCDC